LARQICQVTAGRGPGAEEFCDLEKTVLLPEGEKDLVESLLDDVADIGPVPEKLDKLKKVVKFYLSRMKDDKFLQEMSEKLDKIHEEIKALRESLLNRFDSSERNILSATFDRLDKDRLEIVREILDAAEKDRITKELIEETLEATADLILEIKSMQTEIRDPAIASWDEALNSPELEIENRLMVSIPIIPLLLTYEGSYNFKSGLKLDEAWNKLRNLGRV